MTPLYLLTFLEQLIMSNLVHGATICDEQEQQQQQQDKTYFYGCGYIYPASGHTQSPSDGLKSLGFFPASAYPADIV